MIKYLIAVSFKRILLFFQLVLLGLNVSEDLLELAILLDQQIQLVLQGINIPNHLSSFLIESLQLKKTINYF